jgi:hypothetical protein
MKKSVVTSFIIASMYVLFAQQAFGDGSVTVNGTLGSPWPPHQTSEESPADACSKRCESIAKKCEREAEGSEVAKSKCIPTFCYDCSGGMPATENSASSPSDNSPAPVSDACLTYSSPKYVGGSVGECTRKDGSTGHWYFTYVHSTMGPGCPKEIDFTVKNPDTGDVEQYSTPFNVQVCDHPAGEIAIKQ